jgi:hypothetical protein
MYYRNKNLNEHERYFSFIRFLMLTCISWAQHADVNKQQQQMQQTMAMGGLVVGKPARI